MGNMAYIAHLVDTEDLKELSEMVGTEYAEKLINEYKESYKIGGKYETSARLKRQEAIIQSEK